ncbi:hypothetical protein BX616_004615 [Lobosporangium transversale]|uniref:Uncharacterized protein n=1 Tax=Lobosporangium transversale TaxID=64571 RepID=A0A1Y2GAU3_9FUNG|nr:hypothetical protein BCR41DRAFT_374369 [Lobosporangium transversale]KAF9898007.1 hypothetical protein BX616_004615 [Lobosporangium transversale]ORZ05737.1 hypothetical protein BCR41DRAFT_374369 [Lobosporangium transversale]|eukprot:XP_021877224.1 hypothetical protein BCR41DRAFT_374369 [Lobosporangium transversale]
MSSLCNRMYDEGFGLLGPRHQHGIRARRLSVRKAQLHRREDITTAEFLYAYDHGEINGNMHRKQSDAMMRTLTSTSALSSSSMSSSPLSQLSASGIPSHSTRSTYSAMDHATCAPSFNTSPRHRRYENPAAAGVEDDTANCAFHGHQSAGGLVSWCSSSSSSYAHAHNLGIGAKSSQYSSLGFVPLPPVTFRMNMPGSPLSPYPAHCTYYNLNYHEAELEYSFPPRPTVTKMRGTTRTMGTGGRIGGGGGSSQYIDSPVPSSVHPGQDSNADERDCNDDTEGGENEGSKPVPSAYTFRRRNAIVEGSEDAPRANGFPKSV